MKFGPSHNFTSFKTILQAAHFYIEPIPFGLPLGATRKKFLFKAITHFSVASVRQNIHLTTNFNKLSLLNRFN